MSQLSTLNLRFFICDVILARRIASRIFFESFAPRLSHRERRLLLSMLDSISSFSTPSKSTVKKSSIFSTEPKSRVGKMSLRKESGLKEKTIENWLSTVLMNDLLGNFLRLSILIYLVHYFCLQIKLSIFLVLFGS